MKTMYFKKRKAQFSNNLYVGTIEPYPLAHINY